MKTEEKEGPVEGEGVCLGLVSTAEEEEKKKGKVFRSGLKEGEG